MRTWITRIVGWMLFATALAALFGLPFYVAIAHARDNGQWDAQPASIRQWFQRLMQPDNPRVSCCGEADAYEADSFEIEGDHYVAIVTCNEDPCRRGDGSIAVGTRIPVPNTKMKWDEGNPTGHGIIFIGTQGQVFCYVTPGGI